MRLVLGGGAAGEVEQRKYLQHGEEAVELKGVAAEIPSVIDRAAFQREIDRYGEKSRDQRRQHGWGEPADAPRSQIVQAGEDGERRSAHHRQG